MLARAGLPPVVMVDCSHANSGKEHGRQEEVWHNVIEQRAERDDLSRWPHGGKLSGAWQSTVSGKAVGFALRPIHHGCLHRLGSHRKNAALGCGKAGSGTQNFRRGNSAIGVND